MAKITIAAPTKFSLPKVPQNHPISGGQAARSSVSSYGKLSKSTGGKTTVYVK